MQYLKRYSIQKIFGVLGFKLKAQIQRFVIDRTDS